MIQPSRRDFDQSPGQLDRRRVRHPKIRHVGDAIQLLTQRLIETRMAVTVKIAPQTARAIEILSAVDIDERAAVRPFDHKRLVFRHLRERVPDMFTIPAAKFVVRRHVGHHSTATGAPAQAFSNLAALPLTTAISKKPLEPTSAVNSPA